MEQKKDINKIFEDWNDEEFLQEDYRIGDKVLIDHVLYEIKDVLIDPTHTYCYMCNPCLSNHSDRYCFTSEKMIKV